MTSPDVISLQVPPKTPETDTQFTVDDADLSLKANTVTSPGGNAINSRVVEYQRVCIGGEDASGVS